MLELRKAGATLPDPARMRRRWISRLFEGGLEHAEEAVAISQSNAALHARALLRRGAAWWHLQRFDKAAEDYRAASEEPTLAADPFLCCAALQGLADTLVQQGSYGEARLPLERAQRLATQLGDRRPICHARWVEGLLATRCNDPETGQKHLLAAREELRNLEDMGHFAVVSLDLAETLARTGKTEKCMAVLAEALPHLRALKLEDEGLVGLKLLEQAVQENQLRLDLIGTVRASARLAPNAQAVRDCTASDCGPSRQDR
ncbi:MAG: hypothetical protein HC897_08345 [Thermoanaerobaculia bacterium]|nr:hypothetical protein [Thermoanaerobaculia bacterium]